MDASNNLESIATLLLTDVCHRMSSFNTFLTATDVYRIGLVMYNLLQQEQCLQERIICNNFQTAALAVLQALPGNIRQGLFDDLHEALQQVIIQQDDTLQQEHLIRALESFTGIWSLLLVVTTPRDHGAKKQHARRRIAWRWPKELEITLCFIALYQKLQHMSEACQSLILEFLSLVWLSPIHKDKSSSSSNNNNNNNTASSSSSSKHLEDFLTVLHSLQEQDDTNIWDDLIMHHEQHQQANNVGWRQDLVKSLTQTDATQRDYLSSLLLHEKTPETRSSIIIMPPSTTPTRSKGGVVQNTNTKKDPMQERIDQVRAVIPNVGEEFVEVALSLYRGNAEQAISALLLEPDELPPGLQYVDRQLPRRKNPNLMTLNDDDAQVAKQVTKKAFHAEEERLKQEAAAIYYVSKTEKEDNNTTKENVDYHHHHNEYDDEYDDQWDDLGGTTAGADDGLYDRYLDGGGGDTRSSSSNSNDFQAVLAYNRAMKQVVGEQSFWDEQRNSNRTSALSAAAAVAANETTSYRGPDKIKGGRLPGRGGGAAGVGRGGGGGNQNAKEKKDNAGEQVMPAAAGGKGQKQGSAGSNNSTTTSNNDNKPSKSNQRHKANKLASRREQQKQSMNKRSGG